ncbi:DUF6153 family protein [Micromonosporaceae bacterium Da 78-11]
MGRVARWVLLACTVFGLAAMHTLGHAGMHGPATHEAAGHAIGMRVVGDTAVMTGSITGVIGCAGNGCVQLGARRGGDGDMAGWSVCVAVLTGLAILLLLALLWAGITARRTSLPQRAGGTTGGARAPPLRRVGLMLARVSVLRI